MRKARRRGSDLPRQCQTYIFRREGAVPSLGTTHNFRRALRPSRYIDVYIYIYTHMGIYIYIYVYIHTYIHMIVRVIVMNMNVMIIAINSVDIVIVQSIFRMREAGVAWDRYSGVQGCGV